MKERRQKRVPVPSVPSADAELRRAIGVIQSLHGLRSWDEQNLLGVAEGQEAPSHKDFEKMATLTRGCGPAVGLRERGEQVLRCGDRKQDKRVWREKASSSLAIFLQPASLDQPADKKKTDKPTICVREQGRGRYREGTDVSSTMRERGVGEGKPPLKGSWSGKSTVKGKKRAENGGGRGRRGLSSPGPAIQGQSKQCPLCHQ